MLNINRKFITKFQYFGFVLIILFNLMEKVIATNQKELQNLSVVNNSSEVAYKYSAIKNQNLNKIFKYRVERENCTRAKRSIDRILRRQKRFLVFPTGSYIVVTMAAVKALMFSTPRGYNYLAEVDFYYPLPDKIIRPHHRTTTTTSEPPPPSTMPPEIFEHHNFSDYHGHLPTGWNIKHQHKDYEQLPGGHEHRLEDYNYNNEIFMPENGWKDDIFKNINADERLMHDNMINMDVTNSSRRFWNEDLSFRNLYSNLRPPPLQSKPLRPNDYNKHIQQNRPVYSRGNRATKKPSFEKTMKIENLGSREHEKAHRDRRDLYSQIESVFQHRGIRIRSCIIRAICEAKHFLLPKGKSLFHDIFRILFTMPSKNEFNDDYSNSIRNHEDSDNCWRLYETECPISILELFLKSQKIV